ncbi:cell wall-active antibiotics response protein LiaF [Thalassobacillus devorans]|uniref:cell wall-active antibiotics response protein LiaF n=1 Tax=Thalassobacillus devorans TaxID=279813 RepID=UPI00159470AD|nr:cell wall-active antibiotics response protein LiaF [Thalassobacillus devorans]
MRKGWLHFLLAFLLIGTGIVLMLENLGVIDKTLYISLGLILAVILMLIGLKLWWDRVTGHGGSWMFGSFFTVYGLLVLLGEIGVITFTFGDVFKLWPLLFIYIGFGMFLGGSRKRFQVNVDTGDLSGSSSEKKHNNKKMHTVIGDHQYNAENWKVEPMQLWNAVGDYHFDFTKAFIPEKDTPISVKGWAGDIKMLMPENLDYRIEAFVKAGSINLLGKTSDGINRTTTFETPGYQDAARRLTIDIDLKAGDVRVDKV